MSFILLDDINNAFLVKQLSDSIFLLISTDHIELYTSFRYNPTLDELFVEERSTELSLTLDLELTRRRRNVLVTAQANGPQS